MIRRFFHCGLAGAAAAVMALWLGLTASARAEEPADAGDERLYIVQLRDPPAISANVGKRVSPDGKFDARSQAVRSYAAEQVERHDQLLQSIGAPPDAKVYSYRLSFNGFSARLTPPQAAALSQDPSVARVWEDRPRALRTNASPAYLGLLNGTDGLQVPRGLKGENVVIGVIDSGIATGHPSFADTEPVKGPRMCRSEWGKSALLVRWLCRRFRGRTKQVYAEPAYWQGRCETGEGFDAKQCNNKLIGARFYPEGFRQLYDMDANEFMSPRDADGHGTHIASVAAGNRVSASLGGDAVATVSGVAPRARIAVYKACWLQPGAVRATCAMSDLQRAIEDAVADGVDIINYSVGDTNGSPTDPDALALLAAADVGVLSIVAAGNNGPLPGAIDSPGSSPWVVTVGAASRAGPRFDDALRVTAPATSTGDRSALEAAFTPSLRSTGPVEGELALADDGVGTADDACEVLQNGSGIQDQIVLVRRGGCAFQDKILNAQAAGAAAVVVFSNEGAPFTMSGERGSVGIPAIMIGKADGEALAALLASADPVEVRLDKKQHLTRNDPGNLLYGKSSRGPNVLLPDVLKPDVLAPGTDILGAQTAEVANGVRGEAFQYLSGTSMAVPHVAGAAALLMEAHPEWSPAALRSALVTSARADVLREDGTTPVDSFDAGGGYIQPNRAADPGLVYEVSSEDYDAFACGAGIPRVSDDECVALAESGYPTAVGELNLPSLAIPDLVGSRTLHRRVTNLGPAAVYQARVAAPPGTAVTVSPATLALGAGETGEFSVTVENLGDTALLDTWQFGDVTWTDGAHVVRSPLAVLPQRLAVAEAVTGYGATGAASFEVEFGYDGVYSATSTGLFAPEAFAGSVPDDPLNFYTIQPDDAALPDHVRRYRISVPAGAAYLRVALTAATADSEDDLDLYMICPDSLCPDGSEALGSTTGTSDEVIGILNPDAGEYVLDVHGYETSGGIGGPEAEFVLRAWTIDDQGTAQPLAVAAPAAATVGSRAEVGVSWQNLPPGEIYIGLVSHADGEQERVLTLVEVVSE